MNKVIHLLDSSSNKRTHNEKQPKWMKCIVLNKMHIKCIEKGWARYNPFSVNFFFGLENDPNFFKH